MRSNKLWLRGGVMVLISCGACTSSTATNARPSQNSATGDATYAGSTATWQLAGSGALPVTYDAGAPAAVYAATCPASGCVAMDTRAPDDDGFSVAEGDCDDFAALINPGAYDIPGNGVDEDCTGSDAVSDACDETLAIDANDPFAAARALELCATTDELSRSWGVISARWTTPDGMGQPTSDLMHGLLPSFGVSFTPRGGKTLLALSSGVARAPGQPDYRADCSDVFEEVYNEFPAGFDGSSASCPASAQATQATDAIALELRIRIPSNVSALSFDSAFFTEEYPVWICSEYNDYFQAIVSPLRTGGTQDGNVLFDRDGNPVSVNNSLLGVCEPGTHSGKTFECPLGVKALAGTGYDNCQDETEFDGLFGAGLGGGEISVAQGASTGWLSTEFAVTPAEIITLRFTIWDSTDASLDSLALIDHVHFRLRSEPPPPAQPMTSVIAPD